MQEKYTKRIGHFNLTDRVLGSGAFSKVFLAYSCDQRPFAVKVIPRSQMSSRQIRHFESQVAIMRSLRHQSMVQLVDFKKSQNSFYLFLQYCQGGNLAQYIKRRRKIPQTQAMKIFSQIVRGMSVMHHYRMIHRDLKPANILLKEGRVKIADFGLACRYSKEEMLRSFAGTPLNMAPEILKGMSYNHKADVYSAGTVLYQMLYGTAPFLARDTISLLRAIQQGRFVAPQADSISFQTKNLLKQLLRADPQKRISLEQVLQLIQNYQQQHKKQRIKIYTKQMSAGADAFSVPMGISKGFDSQMHLRNPTDMDLRLYGSLCKRLSSPKIVV